MAHYLSRVLIHSFVIRIFQQVSIIWYQIFTFSIHWDFTVYKIFVILTMMLKWGVIDYDVMKICLTPVCYLLAIRLNFIIEFGFDDWKRFNINIYYLWWMIIICFCIIFRIYKQQSLSLSSKSYHSKNREWNILYQSITVILTCFLKIWNYFIKWYFITTNCRWLYKFSQIVKHACVSCE